MKTMPRLSTHFFFFVLFILTVNNRFYAKYRIAIRSISKKWNNTSRRRRNKQATLVCSYKLCRKNNSVIKRVYEDRKKVNDIYGFEKGDKPYWYFSTSLRKFHFVTNHHWKGKKCLKIHKNDETVRKQNTCSSFVKARICSHLCSFFGKRKSYWSDFSGGDANTNMVQYVHFWERVTLSVRQYVRRIKKYVQENNIVQFIWVCKNVLWERKIFLMTIFTMIHSAIISILIPRYDNILFNDLTNRNFSNFFYLLCSCIGVRIVNMCLCGLRNYIFMITSSECLKKVKKILFLIYLSKEYQYYDNTDHNVVINRLTLEAHDFADIIPYYMNPLIRNIFSVIFNFVYIFHMNRNLSKVILTCFCISSILTIISYKLKRKRMKYINREKGRNTNISLEALKNINIIKIFSTESHEYSKYANSLDTILNLKIKKEQFSLLHMIINKMFVTITYVLILLKGDALLKSNQIDGKTFTSFFFYINNIYSCVDILDYFVDICDIVEQYRHIIALLAGGACTKVGKGPFSMVSSVTKDSDIGKVSGVSHGKMIPDMGSKTSGEKDVVLSFRNVYFRYPNRENGYVLKNVNMKIYRNTSNVILGKSGGGKSTLLKLILNLYKCSKGKIYLYSKLLNKYTSRQIFDHITYVQQDSKLLNATIKENMTYGISDSTNFDMLDLTNISKCCTSHEFISRLRKRYETIVSNKTELLTSSQKQKICIARALIRYPKILLLDESTSAMDKENERAIFQNLSRNSIFKDLTIIRITHKKANLDLSDNVFILKDGYITRQKHI
ncbi:ABC transporter B family member 3, putative [Plasmodium ovale]|uniref:ABC transporter B family member 3, putative n=1 Tax=Plasmodium ovale TaxID=36330 RepID=A0A1D3TIL6_PLAOA|nr:ABC transporter B family member 3, putative [Plasmodium ovale]